jgi:16S rRNA (cytidine1402-2'-O)-methyltransferase
MNKQKKGKLYLIPTPLADNTLDKVLTSQMQEVIKMLDYFLVENVRTARRFISSLKLGISIETLRFELLNKDTESADVERLCAGLLAGNDIGVMSEAGCPGIADPGNLAVAFAHRHHVEVIPLTGPSSVFMALMASGFNGQSFVFHGYLPLEKDKRPQKIKEVEAAAYQLGQTQIFMETPYRNDQLLKDLIDCCKPNTKLCVARDITGADQSIRTKSIRDWGKTKISLHKSPCIFVLHAD